MYFSRKRLLPNLYSITDIAGTHCYLAVGTQKAALVDTGIGLGSLKAYIHEITNLPLVVIGTHGHLDHMGGAWEFDEIYLNPEDFELALGQTVQERIDYARELYTALHPGTVWSVSDSEFLQVRHAGYLPLEDQKRIYLGGITLRLLRLPGHTQGSMAVLFEEERVVIFGDACNPGVFLFGKGSSSVEEYMAELKCFKKSFEMLYDRVLVSHGEEFIDKAILDSCISICEEILHGMDEHIPVKLHGNVAYSAKKTGPFGKRLDGKIGNILYDHKK